MGLRHSPAGLALPGPLPAPRCYNPSSTFYKVDKGKGTRTFYKVGKGKGTKTVAKKIANLLAPVVLAIWYMDHGDKAQNTPSAGYLNLSSFDRELLKEVSGW